MRISNHIEGAKNSKPTRSETFHRRNLIRQDETVKLGLRILWVILDLGVIFILLSGFRKCMGGDSVKQVLSRFLQGRSALVGVLATSLVSWQTANADLLALFEGEVDSGAVALDSSGNNNHAILLGSAGLTPDGQNGGALNFNADTSWAVLNSSPIGNSEIKAEGAAPIGDAFASVNANQAFTVGFWIAGGDTNPRNTSTFWAEGPTPNGGNRAFQAHTTWGNSQAYLDIGGCCAGDTQRINGVLEEEHIKASVGETWSHIAFTYGPEDDDTWSRRMYVNGELYAWGGDGADAEGITEIEPLEGENGYIPLLTKFAIAADNNGGNQWEGRLDDFFVTDNKLEADDIAAVVADGARAYFNVTGTPEPAGAQFNIARDDIGTYGVEAAVTNQVFSEGPVQSTGGLAQFWYAADGDSPQANMRNDDGVFQFASLHLDPDTEDLDYPLVAGGFVHGWWAGSNGGAVPGGSLPKYPADVVDAEFQPAGNSGNYNNYGVRAVGEIFIPENGEYVLRDGIDDMAMIAIDVNNNGELDGVGDLEFADFGTLDGIADGDIIIADDDWAALDGSGNPEQFNGIVEFDNIAEGGEWRKIEIWMAEGGGGDAGILYMGKTDDPDIFDWTAEGALTDAQRIAYTVPPENLRGEGIVLLSADANATLPAGTEYLVQVAADGTADALAVDDLGGLYNTTLDVTGVSLNLDVAEGVADGTSFTIFDAANIVGEDTVTLINADGWTLSGGVLTLGGVVLCDPNSMGDANGDGMVAFDDFLVLSTNFGGAATSHTEGDFNCDGMVAFDDFLILSTNFGQAVGAQSVPEPSGVFLLGFRWIDGWNASSSTQLVKAIQLSKQTQRVQVKLHPLFSYIRDR